MTVTITNCRKCGFSIKVNSENFISDHDFYSVLQDYYDMAVMFGCRKCADRVALSMEVISQKLVLAA